MNLFSKINGYLQKHRFTSQFLLSQLNDATNLEQAIDKRMLHISLNLAGDIDFIAYLSPAKILHIQADPSVISADSISTILSDLSISDVRGVNGPKLLVLKVLPTLQKICQLSAIKTFDDMVYRLELPALEIRYSGPGIPRQLTADDFNDWHRLYVQYLKELELNSSATIEERKLRFQNEVDRLCPLNWGNFRSVHIMLRVRNQAKSAGYSRFHLHAVKALPWVR